MKTPEQIAKEVVGKLVSDNGAVRRINQSIIYRWVEQAIEVDRAQRDPNDDGTLHGAAIMALEDRAGSHFDNGEFREAGLAQEAAQWIDNNLDEFWDKFADPMLDDIERK